MRNKKIFISVILITTAMLFAAGCGKQAEPASAEGVAAVKEIDTEESTVESLEPSPSPTVEPEENMENSETTDNSKNEVDTTVAALQTEEEIEQRPEYEIISIEDTIMYATNNCNIRSGAGIQYDKVGSLSYAQEVTINGKVETGEDKFWYVIKTEDSSTQMVNARMLSETKPIAQTSSINGSGSSSINDGSTESTGNSQTETTQKETAQTGAVSNESVPAQSTQPAPTVPTVSNPAPDTPVPTQTPASTPAPAIPAPVPTPTPAPVHEHVWKDHTATRQVWISNIVVVDDYEVTGGEPYAVFICGCGSYETTDPDAISEHYMECYKAGKTPNYTVQTHYTPQEWTVVGSHEEDLGGYATETYVDYQYCDCGATK